MYIYLLVNLFWIKMICESNNTWEKALYCLVGFVVIGKTIGELREKK